MDKQVLQSFSASIVRQVIIGAAAYFGLAEPDKVGLDHASGLLGTLLVAAVMALWSLLTHKKNLATVPPATQPAPSTPSAFGSMLFLALLLGVGVAVPACSMGGCASAQYDARITPQGLAILADDVQEDVNFGIQASPPADQEALRAEADAFFEAIRTKDAGVIAGSAAPRWGIIKALALDGVDFQIQTDQIGPGVADIHRESVFRFEGLLNRVR